MPFIHYMAHEDEMTTLKQIEENNNNWNVYSFHGSIVDHNY